MDAFFKFRYFGSTAFVGSEQRHTVNQKTADSNKAKRDGDVTQWRDEAEGAS